MIGIYGIKNKINNKIYVGQSMDINKRFSKHIRELRKQKHYNKHLQRSFNKYLECQFELIILEECKSSELGFKEQEWIYKHDKSELYNTFYHIQFLQGDRNPFYGRKHTEKSKHLMSEWRKQNFLGENNPHYGKKHSKESISKIINNHPNIKLCENSVREIVALLKAGVSHQKIADQFKISRTVITRISNGTRWTSVTGGAIVPVVYENGKRIFEQNHKDKIGLKRKGCKHSEETKQLMKEKVLNRKR